MNNKILILVEGITDLIFLRDYIVCNFAFNFKVSQQKDLDYIEFLLNDYVVIKIHNLGGKTKLNNSSIRNRIIADINKESYDNILFFYDADFQVNGEGYRFTENLIINQVNREFNFDYFIFPNNSDLEGTIENLLERIINDSHSGIFECWDSFEACVLNKSVNYSIPAKKSKIYLYLECLSPNTKNGKESIKDKGRDYANGFWNLNNDYLIPLKQFLDKYIV